MRHVSVHVVVIAAWIGLVLHEVFSMEICEVEVTDDY